MDWRTVQRLIEESREEARELVERLVGREGLELLEKLRDYRRVGLDRVVFYVRTPGKINAIKVDKLVEAVRKLFKLENVEVKDVSRGDTRSILLKAEGFELGVICFESQKGCQAWAKIGEGFYDCKIECYGSSKSVAMKLALALAYANVPPENRISCWSA